VLISLRMAVCESGFEAPKSRRSYSYAWAGASGWVVGHCPNSSIRETDSICRSRRIWKPKGYESRPEIGAAVSWGWRAGEASVIIALENPVFLGAFSSRGRAFVPVRTRLTRGRAAQDREAFFNKTLMANVKLARPLGSRLLTVRLKDGWSEAHVDHRSLMRRAPRR